MNGKNNIPVSQPLVSIIIPCMNEEKTIGVCIKKALSTLEREGYEGEIIISDNSTDTSRDIAMKLGVKVVIPYNKGYGNAFLEGFRHAKGKYVLLADADDTYDLTEIRKFLEPLMADKADFVMGTRLRGHIEKGSMPWLHRYIGNPIITSTLNDLFKTHLSDSQCGMRSIVRKEYDKLDLK
ncbi:MAG TPA: glycosyltransferase family 2 protein, partial [Candidatus Methanoperedens sp.]|nr:glycosyltransferase family 2 protein [Candidatus Methanoperedens sp.]